MFKNLFFLFVLLFILSCGGDEADQGIAVTPPSFAINTGTDLEAGIDISNEKQPFNKLSEYGFFKGNMKDFDPKLQVIEYAPSSSLFTDYAEKDRFIYFPKGKKATYNSNFEVFQFPVGTIIIKNFFYYADARNTNSTKRIIETRLLVKRESNWSSYEYEWSSDQTNATRIYSDKIASTINTITKDGESRSITGYKLPTNQCSKCHDIRGAMTPIGPKPSLLNWDFEYADGTAMNQIEKWKSLGYLSEVGLPSTANINKTPSYNDVTKTDYDRGRAYLDINCAHCHRLGGPVEEKALFLNYDNVGNNNIGINKTPNFGTKESGLLYDIVPGKPEESYLLFRMNHTESDWIMPQIGRSINHEDGIEIVSKFIESLN